MSIREVLFIAAGSLRINKLRSVLTTLGIIIGVAAVIVLVGLGDGMKAGFNSTFGQMATQITVSKVDTSVLGGGSQELTDSDVEQLGEGSNAPDVSGVTPVVTGNSVATFGQINYMSSVIGSTSGYLDVTGKTLVAGRMFTEKENEGHSRVVVIGSSALATLFHGDANAALDKQVRIGRSNFKVIGVLASDRQTDEAALMPLTAARSYIVGGTKIVNQAIVKAASPGQVPAVESEVEAVMDKQHRITDPSKRDYKVNAQQTQLENMQQTLTFMTAFTVAIAAISLIVGGIGVANIMLVSVTERTREIGIRKAIGARRSAILKQFLVESTVLAGIGGIVGILGGVGLTLAAVMVLPNIKAAAKFGTPDVSVPAVLASFLFSLLIGLVAGCYPALRASLLRPIEALRFE